MHSFFIFAGPVTLFPLPNSWLTIPEPDGSKLGSIVFRSKKHIASFNKVL